MIPKTKIPVAMPIMRIWLNNAHSAETSGDCANARGTWRRERIVNVVNALRMSLEACDRTNNQHVGFRLCKLRPLIFRLDV